MAEMSREVTVHEIHEMEGQQVFALLAEWTDRIGLDFPIR